MSADEPGTPPTPPSAWPSHQVYFVTVEWRDTPHGPESPERLAQVIRHAIEHNHQVEADAPPAAFVVRVKAESGTAEVPGALRHHHHHG